MGKPRNPMAYHRFPLLFSGNFPYEKSIGCTLVNPVIN
jgi:hypothetical protein